MKKAYFWKFIALFLITLGAQILLSMVESQISDRSRYREQAKRSIEQSWTGNQTILATILVVPYEKQVTYREFDKELRIYVQKTKWIKDQKIILPNTININGDLKHQKLAKGIFQVPVYSSQIMMNSHFDPAPIEELLNNPKRKLLTSYFTTGVKDSRGIMGTPQFSLNTKALALTPGTNLSFYPSGFHAKLSKKVLQTEIEKNKALSFRGHMQLKGMGQLDFLPTGKENVVKVSSDWPHPSFKGKFLPEHRTITDQGYTATWQTGLFAMDMRSVINDCFNGDCSLLQHSAFGVDHIEAVDVYLKSLRSVKYGLLVVIVTFCIFVLYEVIHPAIKIHPISYTLTGMALSLFFLLLIALSEHINFSSAYWLSTFSCVSLISFYVRHISQSVQHGISLFGLLSGFYTVLFFIIRSEDHALLSGSLLLFTLLAAVMYLTRKVDWYQLTQK